MSREISSKSLNLLVVCLINQTFQKMDKTYFFHLFLLAILIVLSLSTENPPKLKLKHSNIKIDSQASDAFLFKNIHQTPSNELSSSYFSVDVSFTPNDQDSTFPMAIALYSSNTVLIAPKGECQHFVPFDCQSFDCLEYQSNKTSTSYPYFNAYGYFGKTYLYLDFANWNLETKTIMATSCIDSKWSSYCGGAYGMLGMGVAVSSWANFRGLQPIFSISIDLDQQDGEVLFSIDSTKFKEEIPPVTLSADNNWRIGNIQSIQIGETQIPTSNFSLLIDINIDAIGFPLSIYDSLLKSFTGPDQKPLECNSSYYKPTCSYSGNITNLPIIYIHIGNQQLIQIPPEIYVKGQSVDGSIVLNIKAVDPSLSDPFNYARKDFANFIFLDSNFFHHYYVVFNGSNYTQNNNTILLYQALHPKKQLDDQDHLIEIIICGIIVGFFLSLLIISCVVRKARGNRNQRIEIHNQNDAVAEQNHSNYEKFPAVVIPRKRKIDPEESELFIKKTKSETNSRPRIVWDRYYFNKSGSDTKIIGDSSHPYYNFDEMFDEEN